MEREVLMPLSRLSNWIRRNQSISDSPCSSHRFDVEMNGVKMDLSKDESYMNGVSFLKSRRYLYSDDEYIKQMEFAKRIDKEDGRRKWD